MRLINIKRTHHRKLSEINEYTNIHRDMITALKWLIEAYESMGAYKHSNFVNKYVIPHLIDHDLVTSLMEWNKLVKANPPDVYLDFVTTVLKRLYSLKVQLDDRDN